jgi:hypothetical protein
MKPAHTAWETSLSSNPDGCRDACGVVTEFGWNCWEICYDSGENPGRKIGVRILSINDY